MMANGVHAKLLGRARIHVKHGKRSTAGLVVVMQMEELRLLGNDLL